MNKLIFLLSIFFIIFSALPFTSCGCPPAAPPVIVAFTATPSEITAGGSTTLMWNVTGATSTSIDQGIGNVAVAGTKVVSPAAATTYTLTATNSAGTVTNSVAVAVQAAPVALPIIVTFNANPNSINAGGSTTLMWNVTGATSTSIDQGIGNVPVIGTKAVSPATSTTYTLTATNAAGNVTNSVTVAVQAATVTQPLITAPPVIVTFSADPSSITAGGLANLMWYVTGATSTSIDQGIGNVPVAGTKVVSPAAATTYTLTATNSAGSVTAMADVNIVVVALAPPCPVGQFYAEYYDWISQLPGPPTVSGAPILSRCEASPINYDWGTGSLGQGVPVDYFMARWTGEFDFAGGNYTFTAKADDGIRIWLDGVPIIDGWKFEVATVYTRSVLVSSGRHQVKVEYFERQGAAICQVRWEK
jgi:hypothetical protein